MEGEIIGALTAVTVGLFGVIAVLLRRNNKNTKGNPGGPNHFTEAAVKNQEILLSLRTDVHELHGLMHHMAGKMTLLTTIVDERLPKAGA